MSAPSLVRIGIISAAHGIRGQVKIRSFTNPPEAIFTYGTLTDAQGKRTFALSKTGEAKELYIASVFGVSDRNESELLKGIELYAPSNMVPKSLAERAVGLKVTLPDGGAYGVIIDVCNFGAGDIVEIKKTNGETEMLPLEDKFIKITKDTAIVTPPEYIEGEK